jgi:PAS domain S-box-containing protein
MPRTPLLQVSASPGAAKVWIPCLFLLTIGALWWSGALGRSFNTSFLPHGFCYDWEPRLVWTHLIADLVIAISYLSISTTLTVLVARARGEIPFSWIVLAFGAFIIACGATHLLEVATLWFPYYWLAANVKVVTAVASLTTAIALPPLLPRILGLLRAAKLSEGRRVQLENTQAVLQGELESQEQTLEKLAADVASRNRELQQSAQQLYTTLTSIGDGVIAADAAGHVSFMNSAAEQMTGWTLSQAIGQPLVFVFRILNETTRQFEESPFERVKRSGGVIDLGNPTLLMARDGREIAIDESGSPILTPEGELTGVILTFRDISDKRTAEEARLLLAAIVNSSQDSIISRDLNGIISSWNKGAERLYGYTAEEMIGKPFAMLLPDDQASSQLLDREKELLSGDLDHIDAPRRCKDGRVLDVSLTVSPIYDYSGRLIGMATIGRDMTAQKLAQTALRTSEKLAATGRLAATIAHEINNPLEAVMNLLYLIETESGAHDGVRNFATQALNELGRVAHITRQTLAFYRDSTRPVTIDLCEVVESLIEIYRREIQEKGIATEVHMEAGLAVDGFPGELRQVFANLIRNAIEAMQRPGTLSISGVRQPEGKVTVTVTDSGPGVPSQSIDQIFEPFFTTKGVNGTGLGLWVTQGIVQKHGGLISVMSPPPGQPTGAEFTLVLPIASQRV